ncbi:MAG: 3-dehydroquinate synthase [Erysipelotrichaceae bacterium]|jgi:3-dehydroquinate synthase|nr:3-dehydroquinate synthase [Erysipelotrichaceae bacterium]
MELIMHVPDGSYHIYLETGILSRVLDFVSNPEVLILTDEGVPAQYYQSIQKQIQASLLIIPQGEHSKSLFQYGQVLHACAKFQLSRKALILALGGGVVGDLAGFVAATYLRGIDYIQIPTTTLAQIDSSIGGKTAINLGETKNQVGAFYHPKAVLIDPLTLRTLDQRNYAAGLVEAVKAGVIGDAGLFSRFEQPISFDQIPEILYSALLVKQKIVEVDPKEQHLRKILNYGHTYGHALESAGGLSGYYHGEAVFLGMLLMSEEPLYQRLLKIGENLGLPLKTDLPLNSLLPYLKADKKAHENGIDMVLVKDLGEALIEHWSMEKVIAKLEENYGRIHQ